jgi:tetratricopeptide (TPR) repeat protein
MFGIHPALPSYLANRWRQDHSDEYMVQRTASENSLLHAYAILGNWLLQQIQAGDAALAYAVIRRQHRTMGRLLSHALLTSQWQYAQSLVQPLDEYWSRGGIVEEARAWTDRIRIALDNPDGTPPPLDDTAGALWLFIVGAHAIRLINAGQLDAAEQAYTDIRNMLQAQPQSVQQRKRLAITFHELGRVAEIRGRLGDAEQWYRRSLTIKEEFGDRPGMASSYHHLGMVAEIRGRLGDAEQWYRRSLTIKEELGDRLGMARSYHHLGIAAEVRCRLDDAEQWYRRSLTIKEEFGDRPLMATSYHQLGVVAQLRGRLDDAEQWHRQSLTINEELGNRPDMASSYHQLGMVAEARRRLDDAEQWYRQSLTIMEELGDRPRIAMSYGQMGLLAERRGHVGEALDWIIRCVALFDDFPDPSTGPGPEHLARLTHQLGLVHLEQRWQHITGRPLPAVVRAFIEA